MEQTENVGNTFQRGFAFQQKGDFDSAIYFYNRALLILPDTSADRLRILTNLSIIFKSKGQYEKALEYAFQSLNSESLSSRAKSSCYNNIGTIYFHAKYFMKSIEFHKLALSERTSAQDNRGIAKSLNNLGNVYNELEQYDSAIFYYRRALTLKQDLQILSDLPSVMHNIGWAYLKLEDFNNSRIFLNQAAKLRFESGQYDKLAYSTNLLGRLYLNEGALDTAKIFLDSTKHLSNVYDLLDVQRQNIYDYSEYYRLLGNYHKQAQLLTEYMIIKDSLLDREKASSLAEMQTKYETEKKDQELISMQKIDKLRLDELKYHRDWSLFLLSASLVFFVVIVIILYLLQVNRKGKKHIEYLNQEMQHRINNNFQLLSGILKMQSGDSEAHDIIKTTQSRLNTMAIIHQKLYKQKEKRLIDIKEYLMELCQYLEYSFSSNNNLKINSQIEALMIDVDQSVYIGLIVNELITNAIKYAFKKMDIDPTIEVSLTAQSSERIFLEVRDNGSGLDSPENMTSSFGSKLIITLTKQLKAESISFNQSGAVFQFSFPLKYETRDRNY